MAELYPGLWLKRNGIEATDIWIEVLAGLDPKMIKSGFERLINKNATWPPGPLEFRALCMPTAEDVGLPEAAESLLLALRPKIYGKPVRRHPAIIYTLRQMGAEFHNLKRADEDKAAKVWGKWWQATIEHVASGGELPEPELEIDHKPKPASKEFARAAMAGIKKSL